MKKIIYIILAVVIIVGITITAIMGLNVDVIYKTHEEVRVHIGKETNIKEIEAIAKEVFENKKIVVSNIEEFNDLFLIKVESCSEEEIENLKQKVAEKYEIEDKETIITKNQIPNLRLRDLIKPYIMPEYYMPLLVSTALILVFMAVRFKNLGSIKVCIQTVLMIGIAELLLFSIIAITRYPVNRYVIPAGLVVYTGTIIITNMQFMKNLEAQKALENKKEE